MRQKNRNSASFISTARRAWPDGCALTACCLWSGVTEAQRSASQSALQPASTQAQGIELLWWIMLWSGVVIFLAVMALLIWALWSGRQRESPLSLTASKNLVLTAGVAIPALTLVILVGGSLFLGRSVASAPPPDAMQVRITGWMWWWEIEYLDSAGNITATTANEMHVPVGRPVAVELASGDVIHSFWVPQLQGKTDMVPGKVNSSWFVATEAGEYRGQCAEFCGLQHALMAFVVVARPEAEFDAWLAHQAEPAAAPVTAATQQGRDVFEQSCGHCHRVRGTDATGNIGPDLTHIASRRTLAAATLVNNRGHLAGWIGDPQRIKPGNAMPRSLLTPQELHNLLTYLETLE